MDLKVLMQTCLDKLISPQIKKLEDAMSKYQIPLPVQPPKSISIPTNLEAARDQAIYRITMSGSQSALMIHVKAINICTNDSLRGLFLNFLNQELHMHDNLIKFGKVKGWVFPPPQYRH